MKAARTEIYGPFEVLERLGVGGMATVHRAIERGQDGRERVVALKRLLPHLAEDEGFVRAFVREAKLASLLQHGNIVEIYELGRVGASYFISMEYIPGRDLRVVMRQARRVCGPPPVRIALALIGALLDALDYAHRKIDTDGTPLGIVHRDISPSNLLVSHGGELKVIDFGIAKATLGYLMTHTGRIKGKLSYMAPEALAGHKVDGRSDLFSASVIAHELLTATPLFAAKDDFQIIERLQNMQPPPPSARNPACPLGLDAIVLRGLAKDPAERWRSAADMRAALADLAVDQFRLATRAEVCDWVEEAFELPSPATAATLGSGPTPSQSPPYLRLPLPAPRARPSASGFPIPAPGSRNVAHRHGSDEEIVDMVWGPSGPNPQAPVVLDEVPDVSSRPPPLEETILGKRIDKFGREPMPSPPPMMPAPPPNASQELLVQAVSAARRAEALAMAVASRQRPSLLIIVVAVAVAVAGAAIVWAVSRGGGRDDRQVVAVVPEATPAPAAPAIPPPAAAATPPAAQVQPMPPSWQGAEPATQPPPETAPGPAPVFAQPDLEERAATSGTVDRETRRETGRRRLRREPVERSRPRRDDREAAVEEPSSASEEPEETGDDDVFAGVEPAEPEPAPAPAPQVEKPKGTAPPAPVRRSGPITVPSSRAKRESGGDRPIRFPAGEQLPREIVAKLCIDPRGTVTLVTVISRVSPGVRNAVERSLSHWRYKPIVEGDEKVAACFATSFPVQLE